MKRHARASSAGSTEDRASRPGRLLRGALAIGGGSLRDKGTAAPSGFRAPARGRRALLAAAAVLVLTLVLGVGLADAVSPTLTVDNASEVSYVSAKATGEVNPEGGEVVSCRFEYVTEEQFVNEGESFAAAELNGQAAPCNNGEVLTGATPVAVAAELVGLAPATTYHLRLVAENAEAERAEGVAGETFETKAVAKPALTIADASAVTTTSAHLAGTVEIANSDSAFTTTTCAFEYITQAAYEEAGETFAGAQQAACAPSPVTGAEPQPVNVSAGATGLEPNTTFHLRLLAENAGGQETATAADTFTTAKARPTVTTLLAVLENSGATARLEGLINPGNLPTTYHFEYGTQGPCETNPCASLPVGPEGTVPAGPATVTVSRFLGGLAPGATYHYRLVATDEVGTTPGADQTFSATAPGQPLEEGGGSCPNEALRLERRQALLPDCRAYELVSPPDKDGGDVIGDPGKTRASVTGEVVGFTSLQAFGDAVGTGIATDYIAERNAQPGTQGWSTHAITPAQEPQSFTAAVSGGAQPFYDGEFSSDLSKGVFRALSAVPTTPPSDQSNVATTRNLYLRNDLLDPGPGSYQLLTNSDVPIPASPTPPNDFNYKPVFAAASADFSHLLFESIADLTPAAGTGTTFHKLYEWSNGEQRLIDQVPAAGTSECTGAACVAASACGVGEICSAAGNGATVNYNHDAISADGSRVFFTTPVNAAGGTATSETSVYMRDDNGTPSTADDTTVKLNTSEKSVPDAPGGAAFGAASRDGRMVFLSSSEQLTDTPGSGLYLYRVEAPAGHHLTLLAKSGYLPRVLGLSESGDTAYFLTPEVLIPGQPTDVGAGGGAYIYRWHQGGPLQYVGALTDGNDVAQNVGENYSAGRRPSRVSADGRFLLFQSRSGEGLTGYQQGSDCTAPGLPCADVYLFDAAANSGTGQLRCLSCLSRGAIPGADAGDILEDGTGGSAISTYLNHPLSADGRYVFFTTGSPLLPADSNGAPDVYEYDTTTSELHLISSGTDPAGSYFMDASPDGKNVFFVTRQRLSGWDTDNSYDLYDARVNGGLSEPPGSAPACQGPACQAAVSAPAIREPGSSLLSGAGNAVHHKKKHKKKHHNHHRRHNNKKHRQGNATRKTSR